MTDYPRFKACCYVTFGGLVVPSKLEGWALFGDIWVHAPEDAHFAIVEVTDGSFAAWEYDPALGGHHAFLKLPPDPRWTGPSADVLAMKAVHDGR